MWFTYRVARSFGNITAASIIVPIFRLGSLLSHRRRSRPDRSARVLVGIPAVILGGTLLILAVGLAVACIEGDPTALFMLAAYTGVAAVLGALIWVGLKTTPQPKPSAGWHGRPGHSCPRCPNPDRPIGPKTLTSTKPPPDDIVELLPLRKPRRNNERPYQWRPYAQPLLPDYDHDRYDNSSG